MKASGGKKRAIAVGDSDEDDVFVPRYGISLFSYCHSDHVYALVLQGTALKKPVLKNLPLLPVQRLLSHRLVRPFLILLCRYLFYLFNFMS